MHYHRFSRRSLLCYVVALALYWRCGRFALTTFFATDSLGLPHRLAGERKPQLDSLPPDSKRHQHASGGGGGNLAFLVVPGLPAVFLPAVGGPALSMLLGGMLPGRVAVSKWGLCASQYFSAGMILAVCGSLTKELTESGLGAAMAVGIGFACGIATMVFVKKVTEAYGSTDDDGKESNEVVKAFPWPLTIAVGIDSLVDGLLLGMIATESPHAVLMMSTATALEMGALGLSFSTGLREQHKQTRAACVLAMPLLLLIGGTIGCLAAAPLRHSPMAMTAMLSFGIAALVYLVTQELLVEANERKEEVDESGTTPWFLFAGYLLVLIIGTLE